jgi:hypothetical protein
VNNPILVCCRVGHDVILETLLSNLIKEKDGEELVKNQLELFATIDGFNPLIASAEQNRSECIKILHKYKANLEIQTSPDNKIMYVFLKFCLVTLILLIIIIYCKLPSNFSKNIKFQHKI